MEEQLYDREMYDYVARDLAKRYKYDDISEHIVDVMISVMMHRDGVRIGGGFVEAINNTSRVVIMFNWRSPIRI
jgi:hypothetical protein